MKSIKTDTNTLLSLKEDKIVELSSCVERRQHPRYPVKLPLDLWQTPDLVLGGVVTDMSEVGLGFRSTHEIQTSADLGIRVYLSRGEFVLTVLKELAGSFGGLPIKNKAGKGTDMECIF